MCIVNIWSIMQFTQVTLINQHRIIKRSFKLCHVHQNFVVFNNSANNLRWNAHVWILVRFLISLEMSTGVPPSAYSAEPLGREPRKYTYFRRLHCEFAFGIFHLSSYTECCPNDNIQYGVWHFRERFVNYHLLCVILMKNLSVIVVDTYVYSFLGKT